VSKLFITILFLGACPLLLAQQMLNNDSVIKLAKAGLSEDLIITTINASPGAYDASANGLIALKGAGVSDKVVSAIILKSTTPTSTAPTQPGIASDAAPASSSSTAQSPDSIPTPAAQHLVQGPAARSTSANGPRVFLQSQSHGNQWNAVRDQSMEMSKDFEKACPELRISLNQQMADYTVALNHIEHGFARDNQIQIANKDGDLISKTKEGGSINGNVKKACDVILADWAKTSAFESGSK
jgi:hypothetical protein